MHAVMTFLSFRCLWMVCLTLHYRIFLKLEVLWVVFSPLACLSSLFLFFLIRCRSGVSKFCGAQFIFDRFSKHNHLSSMGQKAGLRKIQRISTEPILEPLIYLFSNLFVTVLVLLLISISAAHFLSCKITVDIFSDDRSKDDINTVTFSRFLLRNRPAFFLIF